MLIKDLGWQDGLSGFTRMARFTHNDWTYTVAQYDAEYQLTGRPTVDMVFTVNYGPDPVCYRCIDAVELQCLLIEITKGEKAEC